MFENAFYPQRRLDFALWGDFSQRLCHVNIIAHLLEGQLWAMACTKLGKEKRQQMVANHCITASHSANRELKIHVVCVCVCERQVCLPGSTRDKYPAQCDTRQIHLLFFKFCEHFRLFLPSSSLRQRPHFLFHQRVYVLSVRFLITRVKIC